MQKVLLSTFISCIASYAAAAPMAPGQYYGGVAYQQYRVVGKNAFKSFLQKNHPGMGFYVGYQWTSTLSLELGYSWTTRRSHHRFIRTAENLFNEVVSDEFAATTRLRFKNTTLDLVYATPFKHTPNITSLLYIGFNAARPSISVHVSNQTSAHARLLHKLHGKTEPLLRFGAGVQGYLSTTYGYRVLLNYENTSRLKLRVVNENKYKLQGLDRPTRDGISLGLSVWMIF